MQVLTLWHAILKFNDRLLGITEIQCFLDLEYIILLHYNIFYQNICQDNANNIKFSTEVEKLIIKKVSHRSSDDASIFPAKMTIFT